MTRASALLLTFLLTLGAAPAFGQPATPPMSSKAAVTVLMVEVTIARYQGEKRLSSLPYVIGVAPDGSRQTLRVGGSVPIPSTTAPGADGKASMSSYSYRDIGTYIDVTAVPAEDGRYRIGLIVDESSVFPSDETVKSQVLMSGVPAFRSLKSNNAVNLRHGQSVEYTVATDRITGETARISVKLTVVN
jgi:type II secretory pathway component GspD/PulD (secretin)